MASKKAELRTIDIFSGKTGAERIAEAAANDAAEEARGHVSGIDTESHVLGWFTSQARAIKQNRERVRLIRAESGYVLQFLTLKDGRHPLTGTNVLACREFFMGEGQYRELLDCIRENAK